MSEKVSRSSHDAYLRDLLPSQQHVLSSSSSSSRSQPISQGEMDMMRKHLKFIHEDSSDEEETTTPEQRMAKKYFRKLYREYCLCEMSGYREGRIGMRWRTEEEVLSGKGQFICGNLDCDVEESLGRPPRRKRRKSRGSDSDSPDASDSSSDFSDGSDSSRIGRRRSSAKRSGESQRQRRRRSARARKKSKKKRKGRVRESPDEEDRGELFTYEVNFAYREDGQLKQALVKCRLCKRCAYKLNYRKIKQLEKEARRKHEHGESLERKKLNK